MTRRLPASVTGYELGRGRSPIDGADIVAIATVDSSNRKTGPMVQTWILRTDRGPLAAVADGSDAAICGSCPHRRTYAPDLGRHVRTCYVEVGRAPEAIYGAWMRGRYPRADRWTRYAIGAGRAVRLGAYGDPAAVPARIWRDLVRDAVGHTGYTHQWREPFAAEHRGLCMASADSPADYDAARAAGWRTFRVRRPDEPRLAREVVCPASPEGGHRATCAECLLCRGADAARPNMAPGVVIVAHGPAAGQYRRAELTIGGTPCTA